MTIVWDADAQVVDNVTMALGDVCAVDAGAVAIRSILEDPTTALLVIGPGVVLAAALAVSDELRRERPEVGVVLMRQRLDVSVLSQAARAGIREVVDADDLSALDAACRRSRDLSERLGAATVSTLEGRLVTVFSAKGGCGKTALSVNLAAHLAAAGTRTLLVDLDLAFGDDAIALGLAPERSSLELVSMAGSIDGPGLRSVVASHACGLDVLCAPPHPGDGDRITPSLVTEALRAARREYDVVVIDTPPQFDERVIAAFDATDLALVLTTPDIPALKNLRLALDTLDLLGQPEELRRVVLNRAGAKTGLSARDVANALHRAIDVEVPESVDVGQSINRGTPLVLHRPKHAVSVAVGRLLDGTPVAPTAVADRLLEPSPVEPRAFGDASSERGAARTATEPGSTRHQRPGRRRRRRGEVPATPGTPTVTTVQAARA